ncbi:MAG TPA: NosD domain-containing protein [Archangium sp.]|uniref:right-handed parallel beta-helix repeat-containing protein n=1 Tax=Archangium sp. TaxID=1872627 RepID=UPI002ED98179
MNTCSLLSAPLLLGVLLVGCGESPSEEGPGFEPSSKDVVSAPPAPPPGTPVPPVVVSPAPPTPAPEPSPLRIPLPVELRESGATVMVTRLHMSRPPQESVTRVPPGTQEFEVQGTSGEILAVTLLSPAGELVDAVMVRAEDSHRVSRKPHSRVLRVPEEYATLQAAVDAASAGDAVLVAPGTYTETVRLKSDLRLFGSGAAWTVLEGGGAPVKLLDFSGATNVVVAGFTFQNVGRGNVCDDDATATYCAGPWYSAALYADGHFERGEDPTSALVTHNVFRGNSIGVLLYYYARAVVRNNVFVGNDNGLVTNHFNGESLVANNVFWENSRQAIVSDGAYLDVLNNVVAHSGVGVHHAYIQAGRARCNLFFQNDAHLQERFLVPPWFELGQQGNVERDPLFLLPEEGVFRPSFDSPLLDAGCLGASEPEADGTPEDVGAYGGPLGVWQ